MEIIEQISFDNGILSLTREKEVVYLSSINKVVEVEFYCVSSTEEVEPGVFNTVSEFYPIDEEMGAWRALSFRKLHNPFEDTEMGMSMLGIYEDHKRKSISQLYKTIMEWSKENNLAVTLTSTTDGEIKMVIL